MKKILLFIGIIISVSVLPGCKKFLDQQPQTEIGAKQFWKNEDDIKTGLAAMYDGLQNVFDNDFTIWGDARTDEVTVNQYGDDAYVVNGLSATTRGSDWTNFYRTILRANLLIKYIPIIKNEYQTALDQALVNHYMAQAYAVRGFCYFWIIRLWGDAPIWTEPFEDINSAASMPRTPATEMMNTIIIPDLEKAASLSSSSLGNVFEVTRGGIYATLMDVAMWNHDYNKALEWFNKLTALNKYALEATAAWKNVFITPDKSKEAIWNLNWDWVVDGGADASTLIGAGNTNSDFMAEDSVWNYFTLTTNDIRGPQTLDFKVSNQDKFLKFYPVNLNAGGSQIYPNSGEANIYFPFYRLADIYLLRAEVANKLSDPVNALKYLNLVHERAGLPPYAAADFPDEASMENAILEERKLELYMEAKRWFDLVRTEKVMEVMDPYIKKRQIERNSPPVGFGDPRTILWPINRTVLNSNTLLKQNDPY